MLLYDLYEPLHTQKRNDTKGSLTLLPLQPAVACENAALANNLIVKTAVKKGGSAEIPPKCLLLSKWILLMFVL